MIFDIANLTALCNIIDDQEMVKPNQILAGLYLCAYGLCTLCYRVAAVIEFGVKRECIIL